MSAPGSYFFKWFKLGHELNTVVPYYGTPVVFMNVKIDIRSAFLAIFEQKQCRTQLRSEPRPRSRDPSK